MTESTSLVQYIRQPDTLAQFEQVLGKGANAYVQSVAIAVKENPALQDCTYESIVNAALRSASLGLSCDPSQRQAYLVPRSKKSGSGWIKVATFQPHYNGLYNLAQRTGKYFVINVSPVYEGNEVYEDVYTGLHVFKIGEKQDGTPIFGAPESINRYRVAKNDKKAIGYMGYFETKKGFKKSVYMSVEEIEEHAKKYSPGYDNKDSAWKDPKKRPVMQMKTVLIALLKWADLSGGENALLVEALNAENEILEVEAEEVNTFAEEESKVEENVQEVPSEKKFSIEDLMSLVKEKGGSKNEKVSASVKKHHGSMQIGKITSQEVIDAIRKDIENL